MDSGGGVLGSIVVGLFVAVVGGVIVFAITEGGFPPDFSQNTGESSTGESSTGESSTGESSTGESSTGESSTGESSTDGSCLIVISNPLVRLMEEPDNFGLEVGQLPTGSYTVLESRIVQFVGDQRWYRIDSSIGEGWVRDSSIQVESKAGDCS